MKSRTAFVLGLAVALGLPLAIHAQTDLFLGTWKMNPAKSKFDPGPAPMSEIRTYERISDGSSKLTIQITSPGGAVATQSTTLEYDGKPYPAKGGPPFDSFAITRVDPLQAKSTYMRDGKTVGEATGVVSNDGKVLTVTYTLTTSSGTKQHDVVVYDRVLPSTPD